MAPQDIERKTAALAMDLGVGPVPVGSNGKTGAEHVTVERGGAVERLAKQFTGVSVAQALYMLGEEP